MAGKWFGYTAATGLGPGYKPQLVRCYAEGRRVGIAGGAATDNPYDGLSIPAETAWDYGFDNQANAAFKYECQG